MAASHRELKRARKEKTSFVEGVKESLICDRCQQPIDERHKERHLAMLTSARESAVLNQSVAAEVSLGWGARSEGGATFKLFLSSFLSQLAGCKRYGVPAGS